MPKLIKELTMLAKEFNCEPESTQAKIQSALEAEWKELMVGIEARRVLYKIKERVLLKAKMGFSNYEVMKLTQADIMPGYQTTIFMSVPVSSLVNPVAKMVFRLLVRMGLRPRVMLTENDDGDCWQDNYILVVNWGNSRV